MTVKLLLLKSGEDIISDVEEMTFGEGETRRIVGYHLNRPCVVKLKNKESVLEKESGVHKKGYNVNMYPWMPLSKEETVPVVADWVVTMVEPIDRLVQMYREDILENGQDSQSDSSDEQRETDQ